MLPRKPGADYPACQRVRFVIGLLEKTGTNEGTKVGLQLSSVFGI